MSLKKATLIVAIGILLSFSIRIFGIFFTEVFKNIVVVKATIIVNTFFMLFQSLFWFLFFFEYTSTKNQNFKIACVGVMAANVSITLIYLKNLMLVFVIDYRLPSFLYSPWYDAAVPFTSSIIHLYFFIIFKKSISGEERRNLNGALISIIAGTTIFLILHSIVLFNFLLSSELRWIEHMPRFIAVGTVPLLFTAVLLILNFYRRFFQYLKIIEHNFRFSSPTSNFS